MKEIFAYFLCKVNSEIYFVNNTYYNVVWGTNTINPDVYVYKWTGEYCKFKDLPDVDAIFSEWKFIKKFKLKYDENGNISWLDYSRELNEIFY